MESWGCSGCSQVSAAPGCKQKPPGMQLKGTPPCEHLEVSFTEMKHCRHYRYLLVMVCTFSGWIEAFPTRTEKANALSRCLLREIIPRIRFPTSIGSDNSPAFVADLIQQVCKALNIKWKWQTAYRPQSSRMVERQLNSLRDTFRMDHKDWFFMDGLASSSLTQIKGNPTVPWLFSLWNCLWEAPSHSKIGVGKFATGKGGWDFTADGTAG